MRAKQEFDQGDNSFHTVSSPKGTRRKPKLTAMREYRFTEAIKNGANGAEAVIQAGYNVKDRNVASSVAGELLQRPAVLGMLQAHEAEAEGVVISIMNDKHELGQTRISAAKLLLAYTRGNPVSRNENINVNVSLEDILSS